MAEKQFYKLKTDEHFRQLIPPLSVNEQQLLEENISRDGCREPLCVWDDTIIDGHNRYDICRKLKIPFHIQPMDFSSSEEAAAWICSNQLGRRNITDETKRYLIGKKYEAERKLGAHNVTGKNQHSQPEVIDTFYQKYQVYENRGSTAERIGKEYNLSQSTVRKHARYAKTIDNLSKKDPELISKVMTGETKISYKNVLSLFKESHKKEKPTIKDMPAYDPDAEISGLTLTIPSWISSIERTLSLADFHAVSDKAKEKLKDELKNLKYTTESMLLATEDN